MFSSYRMSSTLGVFSPISLVAFCFIVYAVSVGIGTVAGWSATEASILAAIFVPLFVNAVIDMRTFCLIVGWTQLAGIATLMRISYEVYLGADIGTIIYSLLAGIACVLLVCLPAVLRNTREDAQSRLYLGTGDMRLLFLVALIVATDGFQWILAVLLISSLLALAAFLARRIGATQGICGGVPCTESGGKLARHIAFGPFIVAIAWTVELILIPVQRLT
ncbi:hypothetical protein [Arcanobacterium bovis]|uniref:Uncharacterized protein n=1 Tax=Arcanobacterium bovis TaxID=2529275 RepID=A0A4Q9V1C6_9ACTO|nr:hypothetical protein [Arcanobacterium bovis]TBW22910.1 hypothetical protein EZJ44_03165 [Arcanobacterium bovis]